MLFWVLRLIVSGSFQKRGGRLQSILRSLLGRFWCPWWGLLSSLGSFWAHLGLFVYVFLVTVCFRLSNAQLKHETCKRFFISPVNTKGLVACYAGTTKVCQAIPRARDSRESNEWSIAPLTIGTPAKTHLHVSLNGAMASQDSHESWYYHIDSNPIATY